MQLIGTNVSNLHEGTITVEFVGEGNELVSVRMVAGGDIEDNTAVRRARALMVQIATFGEGVEADSGDGDEAPSLEYQKDHLVPAQGDVQVVDVPRS